MVWLSGLIVSGLTKMACDPSRTRDKPIKSAITLKGEGEWLEYARTEEPTEGAQRNLRLLGVYKAYPLKQIGP